jgi:hypothetical protein
MRRQHPNFELDGQDSIPGMRRDFIYPQRPDRLWGPLSLLSNGFRGFFLGSKAAGSWSWPLTSVWCRGQEWRSYIFTPPYVSMLWCLIKHMDKFTFFTSMVYLTMISVAEIIQHGMVNWRRFWKEITVAWFKVLTSQLPGWTEENDEKLGHCSWRPGQYSNWAPSECEVKELPPWANLPRSLCASKLWLLRSTPRPQKRQWNRTVRGKGTQQSFLCGQQVVRFQVSKAIWP